MMSDYKCQPLPEPPEWQKRFMRRAHYLEQQACFFGIPAQLLRPETAYEHAMRRLGEFRERMGIRKESRNE